MRKLILLSILISCVIIGAVWRSGENANKYILVGNRSASFRCESGSSKQVQILPPPYFTLLKSEVDRLNKEHVLEQEQGRKDDVLDEIVKAMCLIESDNKPNCRGKAGERGIMQICRNEWRFGCKLLGVDWSWDDAFEKKKNIAVGRAYMEYLINKHGSWETAVRVYHSGERGALRLGRGYKYLAMVKKAMRLGHTKWRK